MQQVHEHSHLQLVLAHTTLGLHVHVDTKAPHMAHTVNTGGILPSSVLTTCISFEKLKKSVCTRVSGGLVDISKNILCCIQYAHTF